MTEFIQKLNAEMEKNNQNQYIQEIGTFLINLLQNNQELAAQVSGYETKSIEGSIKAMADVARTKAVNGMAMLSAKDGFAIVLNYFGIKADSEAIGEPVVAEIKAPTQSPAPKKAPKVKTPPPKIEQQYEQITLDDFM